MTAAAPAVSVCIPAWNCEQYVGEAIESVLAQTFTDYELIVLDNCSDDGTFRVASGYDDPRLTVLRNETNLGMKGNWDKALELARGTYMKILCADDVIYPDCLELQVAALAEPGVAVACGYRTIVKENGKNIMTMRYPGSGTRVDGGAAIRACARAGINQLGEPSAVLFKTAHARLEGPFSLAYPYVIDLEYWTRLLRHGDLAVVRKPVSTLRVSPISASVSMVKKQHKDVAGLIAHLAARGDTPVTQTDVLLGRAMAWKNSVLRRLFYAFFV